MEFCVIRKVHIYPPQSLTLVAEWRLENEGSHKDSSEMNLEKVWVRDAVQFGSKDVPDGHWFI